MQPVAFLLGPNKEDERIGAEDPITSEIVSDGVGVGSRILEREKNAVFH